jgi:hypothetical protein
MQLGWGDKKCVETFGAETFLEYVFIGVKVGRIWLKIKTNNGLCY